MADIDNEYCFYTPEMLACLLIHLIPEEKIQSVVDISCGQGSLLKAAHMKYPDAKLFGADICDHGFHKTLQGCAFHHGDGFAFAKHCERQFDLILSNPPFGQTDQQSREPSIIQELDRKRLECQMLNADLSLMHEASWLIIILPSTFVTGSSYRKIRETLGNRYQIHSVVLLPEDTFGSRRIRTYAVILFGTPEERSTVLYRVTHGQTWSLHEETLLSNNDIKNGNWWIKKHTTCEIEVELFRGNVSSADFCKSGFPVYHCAAKKNTPWRPTIRYVEKVKKPGKNAAIGDIIINRVGHSTGYWWLNTENEYAVTDCLFVLRGSRISAPMLEQISIDGRLDIPLRGVATPFITRDDVLIRLADIWH